MVEIFINDDRAQHIDGTILNPGKNTLEEAVWEKLNKAKWALYLIEKGLLSVGREEPISVLEQPLPDEEQKPETKIEVPVEEKKER